MAFGSSKYTLYQIQQTMALDIARVRNNGNFFQVKESPYSFIFPIRALTIENVLRWLIIVTTVDRDQILINGSWQTESLSQHFFLIRHTPYPTLVVPERGVVYGLRSRYTSL